jgi:nitrogen fixation protein FixH
MRPARLWPLAVAAVLGSTVVANVALLVYTRNDVDMVEPDYYHKAVTWDSTLARREKSDALGWNADARLGALDNQGRALLCIHVVDHDGRPVEGARVRVTAIHNLDPLHPVRGTLAARGSQGYAASLPLARRGLWELRLDAARGDQRFEADLHADCAGASGPAGAASSVRGHASSLAARPR